MAMESQGAVAPPGGGAEAATPPVASGAPPAPVRDVELVFVIFQGGGAKGLTHVGALKALNEQKLQPFGIAGTSAGAIVAALAAVGYTADELLDPDSRTSILGDKTPIHYLGSADWVRFMLLRRLASPFIVAVATAAIVLASALAWLGVGAFLPQASPPPAWLWAPPRAALWGEALCLALLASRSVWRGGRLLPRRWRARAAAAVALALAWTVAAAIWTDPSGSPPWLVRVAAGVLVAAVLILLLLIAPSVWRGGLFDSTGLRDLINTRLQEKLAKHYEAMGEPRKPPDLVTFADIDPVAVPQCRALKVVATDVAGRRLVLFDTATPSVAVADAVIASAAIPFAFPPPTVRGWTHRIGTVFADGGLVSNLPAWVFTVEKRALERQQQGPPVRTIAFTLIPAAQPADAPKRSLLTYIVDVVETGIFGSQTTVEQFVPDLEVIELPTPLSTFDFDCGWKGACAAHADGKDAALKRLSRDRAIREETSRRLTARLTLLETLIAQTRPTTPKPRLRLYLVDPDGPLERENSEYRVTAIVTTTTADRLPLGPRNAAAPAADTDDRLSLDPRNAAAPAAFRERKPVCAAVANLSARDLWMTRYEYALLAPGLCSIIAVPVFGRELPSDIAKPSPQRVLCLDSSDDLHSMFDDPTFRATLLDLSVGMSKTLIADWVDKGAAGGRSS